MTAINIPELPKFIVNRSGQHKYVFTYKNRWDKETQRSTRGKGDTKSVGKLIEVPGRSDCGEILFNEEFKELYPQLRLLRVFRYKGGRLEFKAIDEDLVNIVKPGQVQRLHAGASWALNQIVGSTALGRVLRSTFPNHKAYNRLLSLAYYLVINKDSSLCNYEEFAECTWLPYRYGVTGGSISRLLRGISKDKVTRFIAKLHQEYNRQYGDSLCERRFWALDSTSITSYSNGIASVEYGHNKDLIQAPQTNVLMVIDQQTGQPLYYRNFDGNVPDVSTIRNTLAEMTLMQADLSKIVLVTDRGYGSAANWDDMLRNGVSFLSNAKLNLNSLIKDLIQEHYGELLDWNHSVPFIDQNAATIPIQWQYDEFPVEGKRQQRKAEKTLYMHLYFSKAINDEATRRLQAKLNAALQQERSNPKKLTQDQENDLKRYTEPTEGGRRRINMYKVNESLKYAGVRVLVSDAVSDALECAVAYEERNQVEYAFNTLKARLNCNRTRVHSTEAWEGKLFLQFIATTISALVRARIKLYNERAKQDKLNYRVHYDSDNKLLAKLNNIYMTQFSNGWVFDEVVGKKKELFKILNVPVPTTEQVIAEEAAEPETDDLGGESVIEIEDEVEDL